MGFCHGFATVERFLVDLAAVAVSQIMEVV